jgi:hypothetical protein
MIETSADEFISLFNLETDGYENPVPLTDEYIGFSVQKRYDEILLKRLGVNKDDPYVCLIYVSIKKTNYEAKDRPPIELSASFCYQKENRFWRGTAHLPKKTMFMPLDIASTDEFFFSKISKKFYYKDKEIAPNTVLNEMFQLHIKFTKPLKGLWLRIKYLWLKVVTPNIYILIKTFFRAVHFIVTLKSYDYDVFQEYLTDSKKPSKETPDNEQRLDILGYKIKATPLITYSFFSLILFTINYFWPFVITPIHNYLSRILANNFLTTLYAVVTLYLWDVFLPDCMRNGVKYFEKKRFSSQFGKMTI